MYNYLQLNDLIVHPLLSAVTGPFYIISILSLSYFISNRLGLTRSHFICISILILITFGQIAMVLSWMHEASRVNLIILGAIPILLSLITMPIFLRSMQYEIANIWKHSCSLWCRFELLLFFILLILFFLLSIAPATDIDSLDYHLGVPVQIIQTHTAVIRPDWLHSRLVGTGEYINLIGLSLGTDNLGAVTNFFAWLGLIYLLPRKGDQQDQLFLIKLVACSPVFLFFVSSQKPQLLGILAIVAAIVTVFKSAKPQNICLAIVTVIAACSIKPSLYLIAIPVIVYLVVYALKYHQLLLVITTGLASYAVCLLPLHAFNVYHYGDPISPLLSTWIGHGNQDQLQAFHNRLKYFAKGYPFPVRLLVPSKFSYIPETLGLGVFAICFIRRVGQRVFWLFAITVTVSLLVIFFGQKMARFFMAPYLLVIMLLAFQTYWPPSHRFFSYLLTLQMLGVIFAAMVGVALLSPGILSWQHRVSVQKHRASYASVMQYLDKRLPDNAVVILDNRNHAMAPRPFISYAYIDVLKDDPSLLSRQLSLYPDATLYLIANEPLQPTHPLYHKVELIEEKHDLVDASRKPFNSQTIGIYIYQIK